MSRERTLEEITGLIGEIVGEEWVAETGVGMETAFATDLELESIEFVELAEKMQARYGSEVDFVGWLSDKEIEEILGLTVGDVVVFVESCRTS